MFDLKNKITQSILYYTAIASFGNLLEYIVYTLSLPDVLTLLYSIASIGGYGYILFTLFIHLKETKQASYLSQLGNGIKVSSIAAFLTGLFHIILSFVFFNYYSSIRDANEEEFARSALDAETIDFALGLINPYIIALFIIVSMFIGGLILSSIIAIFTRYKEDEAL